ncbi:MAG: CCA tRNA nucleotidyltransferase [Desulfonatronovibrio sp.]
MLNKTVIELLRTIEGHGYVALVVGGAVRDHLMSRAVKDIDLATNMPLEMISDLFSAHNVGRSRDFGMLSVGYKGMRFETILLDDSLLRNGSAKAGHEYKSKLFKADARRRDFTINAMAMDAHANIFDPFNGQADIKNRLVRATINPIDRFSEDPIRLLRAVRLSAALDFEIDSRTFKAIIKLSPSIADAAPERTGQEILKICSLPGKSVDRGIRLMDQSGLLTYVLPELEALKGLKHNPVHHPEGGVYEHTLSALEANEQSDPVINLSILFHDVGKAATLSHKDGLPVYYGHDKAGVEIIRNMGRRLKMSSAIIQAMCFAAENHMKGLRINEMRPFKVYKLMSHESWDVLEAVIKCDLASRGKHEALEFEQDTASLRKRIKFWLDKENSKSDPVINGRDVMDITGLPQGPEIGKIIEETLRWAVDNDVRDKKIIQKYIQEVVKKNP